MAHQLQLRWTKVETDNGTWYDSNLVILKGQSGVHLEMGAKGNHVSVFRSLTGKNFVTINQDYFGEILDMILQQPGIGQTLKFRVNHLPIYGIVMGNVEDGGDVDPDNPDDIKYAFAGSEGIYFCDINREYFLGKIPKD